jgi:hypothetical protein
MGVAGLLAVIYGIANGLVYTLDCPECVHKAGSVFLEMALILAGIYLILAALNPTRKEE